MHKTKQAVRATEVASQDGPAQLTDGMFREAVNRHQLGQLAQAEALYRAIIAIHSAPADASYNLGLLLQTERRYPDAEIAYRHAIAVRPDDVEALSNLGTVLQVIVSLRRSGRNVSSGHRASSRLRHGLHQSRDRTEGAEQT